MSFHNNKYYLSNSEYNDWLTLCPLVWKAKHIDKIIDNEPSEPMVWGSLFETIAIGSGVGGKVTEATPAMKKSVFYERAVSQAEDCRKYLKALGGKILSRQEYIYVTIVDNEGGELNICGGLDIRYGFPGQDARPKIIDLKFTGKTDNDFGPYQWGNIDKVDPTQLVHYGILHKAKYGELPDTEFWIFDKSPAMDQKFISVEITEMGEVMHLDKFAKVYNEIMTAIAFDDWGHTNTFANCRTCPVPCEWRRVMPEMNYITA